MTDPPEPPGIDLAALLDEVETRLLGGPRDLTREDVAEQAGMSPDEVSSLWRALGFATVGDDRAVFTAADVAALEDVRALQADGEIDEDLMRAMTRIIGQTFARLASWQGQLVVEIVSRRPELWSGSPAGGEGGELSDLVDEVLPLVSRLHDYVWRRQLAAFFSRSATNAGAGIGTSTEMCVGFVDMAGFTTFTRRSSEAELRDVLSVFETVATDVVGSHGGQIVKTIGDEILFTVAEPHAAAEIALDLLDRAAAEDVLPELRAGVAAGPVVTRLGDVYGQTVNIASRLTSIAHTASVLVDSNLADALGDDPTFVVHAMRPVSVRGYRHLRPSRLRRA